MAKDSKYAKLEAELEKLKKKKAVLQAHIKSASVIEPTEKVCKTIIDFIHGRAADDSLLTPNSSNPYIQVKAEKCCVLC